MSVNLFDGSTSEPIQPKKVKRSVLCGGGKCDLSKVLAVDTPEGTDTHRPVDHGHFINLIRDEALRRGFDIRLEEYSLAKNGSQLFGVYHLDVGNGEHGPAIGFRNAHDKAFSAGMISGVGIMCCDNKCFSGDGAYMFKRHTKNIMEVLEFEIHKAIGESLSHYEKTAIEMTAMKDVNLTLDDGYALLGRALGHDVLKPQQATIAFRDWTKPRHEEFADRNLFTLYQTGNESLKKSQPSTVMGQHIKLHNFAMGLM
jgi:hypothetical protein